MQIQSISFRSLYRSGIVPNIVKLADRFSGEKGVDLAERATTAVLCLVAGWFFLFAAIPLSLAEAFSGRRSLWPYGAMCGFGAAGFLFWVIFLQAEVNEFCGAINILIENLRLFGVEFVSYTDESWPGDPGLLLDFLAALVIEAQEEAASTHSGNSTERAQVLSSAYDEIVKALEVLDLKVPNRASVFQSVEARLKSQSRGEPTPKS